MAMAMAIGEENDDSKAAAAEPKKNQLGWAVLCGALCSFYRAIIT